MGARIRAMDWASTPLGPPETWPQSLRIAIRIILSSRQPFWIGWGPDLIYFYNDPYKSVIGGKHPHALGRPTREVWSELWDDVAPLLDTALTGASGTYVEKQLLIMERNGFPEETYYTFSYSPIPNDEGGVGGIICANTEETGQVIGERQLALLRELAARTAETRNGPDACRRAIEALATNRLDLPFALLYLAEPDGKALSLRARQGIDAGHPAAPETISDENPHPWPPDGIPRGQALRVVDVPDGTFDRGLPRGAWPVPPAKVALVPVSPNGETGRAGILVVGLNPFRIVDESYRGFLGLVAGQIAAAIANAQAYEEERRRAERLAELDRAKTAFFSNVSHEFRTPLTLMLGPLEESLRQPDLPAPIRASLAIAQRNGLRLLRLVNSLLDFSRVEAGRTQARYRPVDLSALTADLASTFRSAFDRAGLRLIVDCPALPEPVHVDHDMWEKIVLNLVSNAFKFTFAGEVAVAVRIDGTDAVMMVRDTGTGIPADQLPRIFERFHRVEGARGRTHEGTGIGLALVRELVHLHGGAIDVASLPDQGTTFTVRIPLGNAHLPPDPAGQKPLQGPNPLRVEAYATEASRWLADGAPTESPPSDLAPARPDADPAARPRVLLADDNADMRDYVGRLLADSFAVEAVADGEAALIAAREFRPDLVLTDVMMPGLDGFGLLHALRADSRLCQVPVILLSARAGEESQIEGLDAGADDYLVKPFSAAELLARIHKNLALARLRRQAAEMLEASEERFRRMADHAPVMIWVTDPDARCVFLSRSWYEFTGQSPDGDIGDGALGAIHPEDRAATRGDLEVAHARRETIRLEFRLRRADGAYRWALAAAGPHFGSDGTFLGFIGSVIDITERKQTELHLKLLVDELNHRVKNTLATVQSIATLGLRGAASAEEAREAIEARLVALSRSHDLLTQTHWEGADLHDVARQALEPFGGEDHTAGRLTIEGPPTRLPPRQALALGMAFHELATNAVKYGALSDAEGRVGIAWAAADGGLRIRWEERDGPAVAPPARRGFGIRLIERGLAGELGGIVNLAFNPSGVSCDISLPTWSPQ